MGALLDTGGRPCWALICTGGWHCWVALLVTDDQGTDHQCRKVLPITVNCIYTVICCGIDTANHVVK
ncbi:unnamed protein product, partial [Staurois parvus]